MDGFNAISSVAQNIYFWITFCVAIGVLYARLMKRAKAPKTISEYINRIDGDQNRATRKIIAYMSCVIVDDKPEDFPVDFMKNFFKSLSIEEKISLNDVGRISAHDIIFLDVADVVSEDLKRGGAILISRLREVKPEAIIVSVSSKKYDVEVTDYFAMADLTMRKPIRAATIEEQLVAHFNKKIGPHALAKEIDMTIDRVVGPGKLKSFARYFESASKGRKPIISDVVRRAGIESRCNRLVSQIKLLQQ